MIIMNVNVYPIYSTICNACNAMTRVQALDGKGLCDCGYEWKFPDTTRVGTCMSCDAVVTLKTWPKHESKKCLKDWLYILTQEANK